MLEPTPWVSTHVFSWAPIVTFGRRRTVLLDWIEENLELRSFVDTDEQLGVAVGSLSQRLRIDRNHLHLDLLSRDSSPSVFRELLTQIFRTLEPNRLHLSSYTAAWSAPLGSDYGVAAGDLAARAAGSTKPGALGPLRDCALFVEQDSEWGNLAYEFGVVDQEQLRKRLTGEASGRMPSLRPRAPTGSTSLDGVAWDWASALFVDQYWETDTSRKKTHVAKADDVLRLVGEVREDARSVVTALRDSLEA